MSEQESVNWQETAGNWKEVAKSRQEKCKQQEVQIRDLEKQLSSMRMKAMHWHAYSLELKTQRDSWQRSSGEWQRGYFALKAAAAKSGLPAYVSPLGIGTEQPQQETVSA